MSNVIEQPYYDFLIWKEHLVFKIYVGYLQDLPLIS